MRMRIARQRSENISRLFKIIGTWGKTSLPILLCLLAISKITILMFGKGGG